MTTATNQSLALVSPGAIEAAVALGKDGVEVLERLHAIAKEERAEAASRDFSAAMAEFQRECPPIRKTSVGKGVTNNGGEFRYTYAELDEIARTVNPLLAKHGLSYTWDSKVADGMLSCVCTLRHANGHSLSSEFVCPIEGTKLMSGPQKGASALTFARRYALVQVLGLTTCDVDDDAPRTRETGDTVSEEQAANISALLEELGGDHRKRFLAWKGVERIADILASEYAACIRGLEKHRRGEVAK